MLAAIPPLALVLGLAALAARLMRGVGGRFVPTPAEFAIVARTRLDGRRSICHIRRGERNILLLTGGGADLVLDRWEHGA